MPKRLALLGREPVAMNRFSYLNLPPSRVVTTREARSTVSTRLFSISSIPAFSYQSGAWAEPPPPTVVWKPGSLARTFAEGGCK
mmetsp:Transcript_45768/g.112526  ORF Transcript_45768/g.112526 Transcript_45768/m.112526 type:complete len:84 (+) Transcript_45768:67-318(+)